MKAHRASALVACVVALLAATALTASAKGRFVATLTTPIPTHAKPGAKLKVAWTVTRPGPNGPIAFDATDVFVRLRGPAGADTREAFATFKPHPDGAYSATVKVPRGGITKIEIGVAGTRTYSNGKSERADLLFPITNAPVLARRG
jgi:hypothetical protein